MSAVSAKECDDEMSESKKYYHQNSKRTFSDRNMVFYLNELQPSITQEEEKKYEKYSPKRYSQTQMIPWNEKND